MGDTQRFSYPLIIGTSTGNRVETGLTYEKALRGPAVTPLSLGAIRLRGRDVSDFLNRMSTQATITRPPGSAFQNVLTNDKGRIVDLVWQLHSGSDVTLLSGHRDGTISFNWLQKYLFSEDVLIEDISTSSGRYAVVGEEGAAFIRSMFGPDAVPEHGRCSRLASGSGWITCFRDLLFRIPVYQILDEGIASDSTVFWMIRDNPDLMRIDPSVLEVLRIESGIPSIGFDIDTTVNPLEAGLHETISFSKGCYIGQEVIARIETYSKLQKRLVGFSFPLAGEVPLSPGNITQAGLTVGRTTSHCFSPGMRREIALGYLGVRASETGLTLETADGKVDAVVHRLPFEV
jgi:tRNA-modifying protein YgfZ